MQHEGNFENGRAVVKNSGKWGVIDNKMNIIIPFEYDSIEYLNNSDQNLFKLSLKNSKMGLINKHGVFLTEMEYDEIGKSCNGMRIGKKKTGYGFLNNRGKEITKFDYNKVSEFDDEMAAVKVRDKWGYIGTDGEMLIEPKFKKAEGFSDGMAFVYRKNETGFINKSGDLVFNIKCNKALKYLNGVAWIKESRVYGLIDKSGKWIIKPKYQYVAPFSENLSIVSNRRFGLVNNNGEVVTPMKYNYIGRLTESGMAIYSRNSRYGFMDSKGAIVIEAAYDNVSEFSNGYAIVCKNNIYSVIDISGVPVQNLEKGERTENTFVGDSSLIAKESIGKSVKFTINELLDAIKTNSPILYDNVNNEKYFLKKVKSRTTGYILLNEVENDSINGTLTINNVKVDYKNKFSFTKYNDFYSNFECWDYLASIGEGVAKYRYDVLYGIADYDGKIIFKPKFDNISYYAKGIYKLKYQSQVCYLKKEGIWLWKPNEFKLSFN